MHYRELEREVVHGKKHRAERPPQSFLNELVAWGRVAPSDIFEPRGYNNVYKAVFRVLGPYHGNYHRRAVMLEVMRVLAGYESSWVWTTGVDLHPQAEVKTATTTEAGAWQVSANSMHLAVELKKLVLARTGSVEPLKFQQAMKKHHTLAMEYIARLLRHTIAANGPVKRHDTEIDHYIRRSAVAEFMDILSPGSTNATFYSGHMSVHFSALGLWDRPDKLGRL